MLTVHHPVQHPTRGCCAVPRCCIAKPHASFTPSSSHCQAPSSCSPLPRNCPLTRHGCQASHPGAWRSRIPPPRIRSFGLILFFGSAAPVELLRRPSSSSTTSVWCSLTDSAARGRPLRRCCHSPGHAVSLSLLHPLGASPSRPSRTLPVGVAYRLLDGLGPVFWTFSVS